MWTVAKSFGDWLLVDRSSKLCQCHRRSFHYDFKNGAIRYDRFFSTQITTKRRRRCFNWVCNPQHPAQSFPQMEDVYTGPHIMPSISHISRRTTGSSMVHWGEKITSREVQNQLFMPTEKLCGQADLYTLKLTTLGTANWLDPSGPDSASQNSVRGEQMF